MPANSPGSLSFSKLEALGNDFMLVDARQQRFEPGPALIRHLGDRRLGVGFDQLLILRRGEQSGYCRVDIRNRDGSTAEQCGNGMRAVALWLATRDGISGRVELATAGGTVEVASLDEAIFSATLPEPVFTPLSVGLSGVPGFPWRTDVDGETLDVHGASLGNPHLLVIDPREPDAPRLEHIGQHLGRHPALADGANVGLATVQSRSRIRLRVFERGAGPTQACGSGATAAAAIAMRLGHVDSPVEVVQPGGTLVVNWRGPGHPVATAGPARHVFEGVIAWPIDPP